jgi:hypothetical protein
MNNQLERMRQKITIDSLESLKSLIDNDNDFNDVYCMLRDHNHLNSKFKIKLLYITNNYKKRMMSESEHSRIHHINDKKHYLKTIPPIVRIKNSFRYMGNDGNHRINTCEAFNISLPVVLIILV